MAEVVTQQLGLPWWLWWLIWLTIGSIIVSIFFWFFIGIC